MTMNPCRTRSVRVPRSAFRVPSCLVVLASLAGAAAAVSLDGTKDDTPEAERKILSDPKATPSTLVGKLSDADWQVRERAMRDLIALGAPSRAALRIAVSSPDAEVRWRALYALSQIEIGFDLTATDPARKLYATAAETRLQKGGAVAAKLLYQEVVERFPDTRWAAAARERLAGPPPEPKRPEPPKAPAETLARLVAKLGVADWGERQEASCRLAALGLAARPALEAAARSPDPEVAWRARKLLDRLPQDDAAAQQAPGTEEPKVRLEAGGKPEDPEQPGATPANLDRLVRSLGSDEPAEVTGAREVLFDLGPKALDALVRGLDGCTEVGGVEIMDLLQRVTRQSFGFDPERWRSWWRTQRSRGRR